MRRIDSSTSSFVVDSISYNEAACLSSQIGINLNPKKVQVVINQQLKKQEVAKALKRASATSFYDPSTVNFSVVQKEGGFFFKIQDQYFPVEINFPSSKSASSPLKMEKQYQKTDKSSLKIEKNEEEILSYLQGRVGIRAIPDDLDAKSQDTAFKAFRKWLRLYLPLADDVIAIVSVFLELFKVEHDSIEALDHSATLVDVINNVLRLRSGYNECKYAKQTHDMEGGIGGSLLIGRGISSLFGIGWINIPFVYTAFGLPTLGLVSSIAALSPVGWGAFMTSYVAGAAWYSYVIARSFVFQSKLIEMLLKKSKGGNQLTLDERYDLVFEYLKNQIYPSERKLKNIIHKLNQKHPKLSEDELKNLAEKRAARQEKKMQRVFSRIMGGNSIYLIEKALKMYGDENGSIESAKIKSKLVKAVLLEGIKRQILLTAVLVLLSVTITTLALYMFGFGGVPILILALSAAILSLGVTLYEIYQKKRSKRYKLLLAEGDNLEVADVTI